MRTELHRVQTRRDRRRFVAIPRSIFGKSPVFVPPHVPTEANRIDPSRNPFFEHATSTFWIAHRRGRPVGRISATVDHLAIEWTGERRGVFGHFLAQDEETARCLFDAALDELARAGMQSVRGPIELSTNYTCGLQVSGFEHRPMVDMNQHPPGHEAYVLARGFARVKDLLAYRISVEQLDRSRLDRGAQLARRRSGARIRGLDLRRFDDEVETLHEVYSAAWERNFGFVPMSRAEFTYAARTLRRVLDPSLVRIAERDRRAVGFALGLPDVNVGLAACNGRLFPFGFVRYLQAMRANDQFRVLTLGLVPQARSLGIDMLLIHDLVQNGMAAGYRKAELSWVLEDNLRMIRPIERIGGEPAIRYRLFDRDL